MRKNYRNYPPDMARRAIRQLPGSRKEVATYWLELALDAGHTSDEAHQIALQRALRARFGGYPHWDGFWIPGDDSPLPDRASQAQLF